MQPVSHDKYEGLPALYPVLDRLARQFAPASYLEIGVRDGASLVCVLSAYPSIRRLALADTWESDYGGTGRASHQHIGVLLAALDATKDVLYLDGDSKETIPRLRGETFDMILVDGDHSDAGVAADLENCYEVLAPGGILVTDDISNPGHVGIATIVKQFAEAKRMLMLQWVPMGVGAAAFRKAI